MKDKRFLEESFPVKEVGFESAREKSIRHGHISTLHIWWARRPLASSRAINYAALIPAPDPENIDEWNKKREFIINFSKWENSLNRSLIEKSRKDILQANVCIPKVLDPFAGGGTIPLEALRLGCETYSSDYNPVAVLIQKCTLEYPQSYGHLKEAKEEWGVLSGRDQVNPLLEDVRKWGNWILEDTKKEIARFYPEECGNILVGFIWVNTIPCQNPTCVIEIPLMRRYLLAKKAKKDTSLYPYIEDKEVQFKIVGEGYEKMPEGFDPKKGTISRAIVTCPVCGSVVDAKTTRKLFQECKSGQRMVAAILHNPNEQGKTYRVATEEDMRIFEEAEKYLDEKQEKLMQDWGINPVPDEPLPPKETLGFRIQRYGMQKWGDLFNSRQKLALISFVEKIRIVYDKLVENGYEEEYAKAVTSYLALGVDRLADYNSILCVWTVAGEFVTHVFGRAALPMVFDHFELNPFSKATGDWNSALGWILRVIEHLSPTSPIPATVIQSSATVLPYPDNFFDAVLTDPPYYDNVPYSHLSDFFYVWLKRTVGHLYPELFSTPLTPKSNEIVAYLHGDTDFEEGKQFFESMLKKSFQEIYRVLKPNGIFVNVYAHKSTKGWETLINSLLDSGLIMTGAWPLHTERQARFRAKKSAALASSIYIVARKMHRQSTGFYNEVKEELKKYLNKKLHRLWKEGISGADFFVAAIGSAIEVFGKYKKVIDFEGKIIQADQLLSDVREIATDYAVHQILQNGFTGEISNQTRFYVLWRWNYGEATVHFDEARKLAQSCGIDLTHEWNRDKSFIRKKKEIIHVLGPQDRKLEDLNESNELVDVLHSVLLIWERGKRDEMMELLQKSGYGKNEAFYRAAQAISETLPSASKEKKLLDGFLAGKDRITDEITKKTVQRRLFE